MVALLAIHWRSLYNKDVIYFIGSSYKLTPCISDIAIGNCIIYVGKIKGANIIFTKVFVVDKAQRRLQLASHVRLFMSRINKNANKRLFFCHFDGNPKPALRRNKEYTSL